MVKIRETDIIDYMPLEVNQNSDTISMDAAHDYSLRKLSLEDEIFSHQDIGARFFSSHSENDRCLLIHEPGSGKCVLPGTRIYHNRNAFESIENVWNDSFGYSVADTNPDGRWKYPFITKTVRCYDIDNHAFVQKPIKALYRQNVSEMINVVELDNGIVIEMTKRHKLLSQNGWTNEYEVGDFVILDSEIAMVSISSIVSITERYYQGYVYDFEVADHHNYIANGIVTHNTCTSAIIHERFKEGLLSGKKRPPAYVIVPNPELINQYIKQIQGTCTSDVYNVNVDKTDSRYMRRLRKEVSKSYEMTTLDKFSATFQDKSISDIRSKLSGRDIIIDEGHLIRVQPPKTDREGPIVKKKINTYNTFKNTLEVVQNSRIFILTATPLWDKVHEYADLMNLILPKEKRFANPKRLFMKEYFNKKTYEFKEEKRAEFKDKIRGYVSFVRTRIEGTTVIRHGRLMPGATKGNKATYLKMSEYQSNMVKLAQSREKEGTKSLMHNSRNASTMVFPKFTKDGKVDKTNAHIGKRGFTASVTGKKTFRFKHPNVSHEIKTNLKQYSVKYDYILRYLKENPKKVTMIYEESINSPGGLMGLGMVLKLHGFVWARSPSEIASKSKKRRFIVMSSSEASISSQAQITRARDIISQPDNMYGEYCSVVIISKKLATGNDFSNIRAFFQFPFWNRSQSKQSRGRVERARALSALPANERTIDEFNLIAVLNDNFEKSPDVIVFKIAEIKALLNSEIMRASIESSWDCALMYNRNIGIAHKDNSEECYFKECNYVCDGYDETLIDTSRKQWVYNVDPDKVSYGNYLIYNADESEYIEKCIALFKNYFYLTHGAVIALLDEQDAKVDIIMTTRALYRIVADRIPLINPYGFRNYLNEDNGIYFLGNTPRIMTDYKNATMASHPIIASKISLGSAVINIDIDNDKILIKDVISNQTISKKNLEKLHYSTIVVFIERMINYGTVLRNQVVNMYPENIKVVDSKIYHNFYTVSYQGIGVPTIFRNLDLSKVKVYSKRWNYVESRAVAGSIFKEPKQKEIQKKQKKKVIAPDWKDMPLGFYGINAGGKFKIRAKPLPGEKETTGSVCKESGWPIPKLLTLFIDLDEYPIPAANSGTKESLINSIKESNRGVIVDKLDNLPIDKIRGLIAIKNSSKATICAELQKILKRRKYYVNES